MANVPEPDWMDPYLLDEDEEITNTLPTRTENRSMFSPRRNVEQAQRHPRTPPPQIPQQVLPQVNPFDADNRSVSEFSFGSTVEGYSSQPVQRPTAQRHQVPIAQRELPNPSPQYTSQPVRAVNIQPPPMVNLRLVIAIDYGTTYTGLAVALINSDHANLGDIEVLQNWGRNGDDNMDKVRTMISYIKSATGQTQWGAAVGDHIAAMVNTKLELDPQTSKFDELELTWYLLRGTGNLAFQHLKSIGPDPAYPSAPPKQIVQDYLRHIYESMWRKVPNGAGGSTGVFTKIDLENLIKTKTPVDIVITVPAVRSKSFAPGVMC